MALEPRIAMASGDDNPSNGGGEAGAPFGSGIGYSFSNWPAAALRGIELNALNTFPTVGPRSMGARADADWVFRDPFPIANLDGTPARIGGWYVVAGLASERDDPIGTLREFSYVISRDGVHWQEGGTLISAESGGLGDQLFSGDMRYDAANNRLLVYYTPVVGSGPAEYVQSPSGLHMRQEVAIAEFTPVATETDLNFVDMVQHGIKLRPDGRWYARPEEANTETEVYGFRDPFFFRDPESGRDFLLLTTNWGTDQTIGYQPDAVTGDQAFPDAGPMDVVAGQPRSDGAVGLAVATDASLTNWELLPPIFGAIGVNEQLELPHFVYQDGRYYLFLTTHNRTFIGDLKFDYPEGLYGFVADDLQGPYRPLNGTSLVITNPPEEPLQNYAWKVIATGGGKADVISFINKGGSGTVSPTVQIAIEGESASITRMQPISGLDQGDSPIVYAFGSTPLAPKGSTPVEANADRMTRNFVIDVFQDLLGRAPDQEGLEAWLDRLDGGLDRAGLVSEIVASPEYLATQVRTAYTTYLDRAPDADGLRTWTAFLSDGNSATDLAAALVASEEYALRKGRSVDAFLEALYQDVFNRPVDPQGRATWTGALNSGMSREQVADAIFGSEEYQGVRVDRLYSRYLFRDADSAGRDGWLDELARGAPYEQLIVGFIGSDEYGFRNGTLSRNRRGTA